MTNDTSKLIAEQNDQFRKNFGNPIAEAKEIKGKYVATQGFCAMSPEDQITATVKIRDFDNFNSDNDPYGEHDLGRFKQNGHTIMWKIDYYDTDYKYGSNEPSDPTQTRRVLTAMLANEY